MKLCQFCQKEMGDEATICEHCKSIHQDNYNRTSYDWHPTISNADYYALKHVMWPYIHAKEPSAVEIPHYPSHLEDHPLVQAIRKYQESGQKEYLDQAGQILCPSKEPFGWYVALTK